MGFKIKIFANDSFLEYDRGNFDDWCVYLTEPDKGRRALRDRDYFTELKNYAKKYGEKKIYQDYVKVYDLTNKCIEKDSLEKITEISSEYSQDALKIDIIFSILYMAMIAEEQKKNTRLGKRIKRLGIHILLMENGSPSYSADFMRGMNWKEIDKLCKKRGF